MSHENMDYEGILHAAGHRMTLQRVMILDAVCEGGGHTTLKEITARLHNADPSRPVRDLRRVPCGSDR